MFLTSVSGRATRACGLGNMHRVRVLVVEDERKLAQILASALQAEHYDVVVAATGEDGFFRANAEVFDLVVRDLMVALAGIGGYVLARRALTPIDRLAPEPRRISAQR